MPLTTTICAARRTRPARRAEMIRPEFSFEKRKRFHAVSARNFSIPFFGFASSVQMVLKVCYHKASREKGDDDPACDAPGVHGGHRWRRRVAGGGAGEQQRGTRCRVHDG